jgi:hypothetical protein
MLMYIAKFKNYQGINLIRYIISDFFFCNFGKHLFILLWTQFYYDRGK